MNTDINFKKDKEIGDYVIKNTLGKGTFSKVKLGIHKKTKEKVAIKILEKSKIVDNDDLERIAREMNIIKDLDHMNVIRVIKMKQTSENYLILMELCEEGELFNYIVQNQRLSEEEASYFYYQLVNGIEYIHSKGVVHRDLKPENLLLTQDHILKIIDFGLSNYYNGKLLSTPCGSPCYASPEMVSGNKYNGYRIDIWSSGIILFAMLCGYLPFEDPDNEKLFKKILECKLSYPSHVSKTAKNLMKRILVTNPDIRITIEEIKQHPFYIQGKNFFNYLHMSPEEEKQMIMNTVQTEPNCKIPLNNIDCNNEAEAEIKFKEYLQSSIPSTKNNKIIKVPKVSIIPGKVVSDAHHNTSINANNNNSNNNNNKKSPPSNGHSILLTDFDVIDRIALNKNIPSFMNATLRNTTTTTTTTSPHHNLTNLLGVNNFKLTINNGDKKKGMSRPIKPKSQRKKIESSIVNTRSPIIQLNLYEPNMMMKGTPFVHAPRIQPIVSNMPKERHRLPSIRITDYKNGKTKPIVNKKFEHLQTDIGVAHPRVKTMKAIDTMRGNKTIYHNAASLLTKGYEKPSRGIRLFNYKNFL